MYTIQQITGRSSSSFVTLVLLAILAVLAVYVTSAEADGDGMTGAGEGGEMTAMADAIKYLQGLDKVYGQAARPRFGKRGRYPYLDLDDLQAVARPQHAY